MELCFWLSLFSKLLRFAVVVQDDRRVAHIPINRNEVPEVSILRPSISNLRPKFGHDSKSRFVSNSPRPSKAESSAPGGSPPIGK